MAANPDRRGTTRWNGRNRHPLHWLIIQSLLCTCCEGLPAAGIPSNPAHCKQPRAVNREPAVFSPSHIAAERTAARARAVQRCVDGPRAAPPCCAAARCCEGGSSFYLYISIYIIKIWRARVPGPSIAQEKVEHRQQTSLYVSPGRERPAHEPACAWCYMCEDFMRFMSAVAGNISIGSHVLIFSKKIAEPWRIGRYKARFATHTWLGRGPIESNMYGVEVLAPRFWGGGFRARAKL
jgi:hypothetical protein